MKLSIDDTLLNYILEEELFDIWEIDFMKLFPPTAWCRVPKGNHLFDNGQLKQNEKRKRELVTIYKQIYEAQSKPS